MRTYGGWPISRGGLYNPDGRVRGQRIHHGLDVDCDSGSELAAPFDFRCFWPFGRGEHSIYGWVIDLIGRWHADVIELRLAHLSLRFTADDERGPDGEVVALSGGNDGAPGAGNSTGSHCHIEMRANGILVDPESRPDLLEAVFNGGIPMTKEELRDLVDRRLGRAFQLLGADLVERGEKNSDTTVVLEGRAYTKVGERLKLDAGKD